MHRDRAEAEHVASVCSALGVHRTEGDMAHDFVDCARHERNG